MMRSGFASGLNCPSTQKIQGSNAQREFPASEPRFGPSLGRLFDLDDRCPESGDTWETEPCRDERLIGTGT
jgi:hypothetical protein